MYVSLGPPDEIESHPSAQGGTPAYEIWRYNPVPGVRASQSFTFADTGNNGDYRLQTPESGNGQPIFNKLSWWVVTDAMGRYVTGLQQEHFDLRENGFSKSLLYFQPPDSSISIAICAASDFPELKAAGVTSLTQTRNFGDAVRYLANQHTTRRALIDAGCSGSGAVPAGTLVMKAQPTEIYKIVITAANQYVAGYISNGGKPEIALRPPAGMPTLRIDQLIQQ